MKEVKRIKAKQEESSKAFEQMCLKFDKQKAMKSKGMRFKGLKSFMKEKFNPLMALQS